MIHAMALQASGAVQGLVSSVLEHGHALTEDEVVELFEARGADFHYVCQAADLLRKRTCGDMYALLPSPFSCNSCSSMLSFLQFTTFVGAWLGPAPIAHMQMQCYEPIGA